MNSVEAMNSDVYKLGQYYTDRKTVTYMCKKVSNKDNELLASMFDLPCGTGRFSTMNNNENKNKNETTTTNVN
jgi:predicted RNA methylase